MPASYRKYLTITLSMVFWSLSYVWIKTALDVYDPITITVLRLAISAIILSVIIFATGQFERIKKEDYKLIALLAFFEPFLYFVGETHGMQYVSPTIGSVIIATIPLFTPIAAFLFTKERLSNTGIIGLLISFIGVSLVVMTPDANIEASSKGISLMFLAVFAGVGYSIILRKIAHKYKGMTIILYQNIGGLLYFSPLFFAFKFQDFIHTPINTNAIIVIIQLAVFASTLAFLFFTYAVRQLGINTSNLFTNLIPVFTAIFAFAILGETPTSRNIIGIGIVIGGLFISQLDYGKIKAKIIGK